MLSIIAERTRQEILRIVWREERSADEIAGQFGITFGAISQHLRILRESGAVDLRKQGRTHFYKANHQKLGPLAQYLGPFLGGRLTARKNLAEDDELLTKPRN